LGGSGFGSGFPGIQDGYASALKVSDIARDEGHAMNKGSGGDQRIAVLQRVRHE